MTSTCSTPSFQSKFEKQLMTDENRPIIESAISRFCNLNPDTDKALQTLWGLTYHPDVIYKVLASLDLSTEIIPLSKVPKFRSHLKYKYEQLHSNYFTRNLTDDCRVVSAFNALTKSADIIIAAIVYKYCFQHIYYVVLPKTLGLLSSSSENVFFGGLRNLGFTRKEADYLKPFHMEIYNLLLALGEQSGKVVFSKPSHFDGLQSVVVQPDDNDSLPFAFSEKSNEAVNTPAETSSAVEEVQPAEISETESEAIQPAEISSGFKPLTFESIEENEKEFSGFVNGHIDSLYELGQLGFDLNSVLVRKEAICKILEVLTFQKQVKQEETKLDLMRGKLNKMKANAIQDLASALE